MSQIKGKWGVEPYFHVFWGACSWVRAFWITLFLSWCLMLCFQLFFAPWQIFNNFSFLFVLLLFGLYCSHSFATHIILFLLAFSCLFCLLFFTFSYSPQGTYFIVWYFLALLFSALLLEHFHLKTIDNSSILK